MKEKKQILTKANALDFLSMTVGVLLLTVGVYFFKIPNGFSTGGVSGIATVLGKLVESEVFTPALFITIINTALLLVGLLVVGREFGLKTVYCSLMFSGLTILLDPAGQPDSDLESSFLCQPP